jgi:hypothetical protein
MRRSVLLVLLAGLALSGCTVNVVSPLPAATEDLYASPTSVSTATPAPSAYNETPPECGPYNEAMEGLNSLTAESSAEAFADAYEELAFALNDHAAASATEMQKAIAQLVTVAATSADNLRSDGGLDVQEQLTFERAVTTAGDLCGVHWGFE